MDNIQQYRQPMVTATGIYLGFMLNFTSVWIRDAFTKHSFKDVVVAISIIVCLSSLLLVLFRMLRMTYPTAPDKFYRRTLVLFLVGVSIPFVAFLLIIVEKFVTNVI